MSLMMWQLFSFLFVIPLLRELHSSTNAPIRFVIRWDTTIGRSNEDHLIFKGSFGLYFDAVV